MNDKTLTLSKKPADEAPAAAAPAKHPMFGKSVRVCTAPGYSNMVHLLQNKLVDSEGKRLEVDDFTAAQLDAGKWLIAED